MIKLFEEFINEDSLDDFDIDGKIAKERAGVSDQRKQEVSRLISKTIAKIEKNCKSFFESKGLNLKPAGMYVRSNTYKLEYPNLSWGFTYSQRDGLSFLVVIGEYARIDGIEKDKNYEFLREFAEFIKSKIKYLRCNDDIWQDSITGIHGSASFIVRFTTEVKDLK